MAVGGTFQGIVVNHQQFTLYRINIQLNPWTFHGDSQFEGGQRVFRRIATGATVADTNHPAHNFIIIGQQQSINNDRLITIDK